MKAGKFYEPKEFDITHPFSKSVIIVAIAAILPAGLAAKPKQKKLSVISIVAPHVSGYVVIELENGARDKLRVTEGQARATLPNIMANDVDFITVIGAYIIVTVYQHPNFRGHGLTLRCGNYELVEQPRNDIESIQVRYIKTPVSECQDSEGQLVEYRTWDR